jgi:hypothetical protein
MRDWLATADLLQLQCFFVPSKVHAPESYEQGVAALRDALGKCVGSSHPRLADEAHRALDALNEFEN